MCSYKLIYFSCIATSLVILDGFSDEPIGTSSEPSNTTTDILYNPHGKQVGSVSVTPPASGSTERSTFNYSGDRGTVKGSVSTSNSTENPEETFYDSHEKKVGSSSTSHDAEAGTSRKTFYDSQGKVLGKTEPKKEQNETSNLP